MGLDGYELQITGGSDKEGFPMRNDIKGISRKKIVVTKGIGFHARKGLRRRKLIRGNTISTETAQINFKVVKAGHKHLAEIFPKKEEAKEA